MSFIMLYDYMEGQNLLLSSGWVHYHISNVMQYSNTTPETTSLVVYDSKSFSMWGPFFLWLCKFYKHKLCIITILVR